MDETEAKTIAELFGLVIERVNEAKTKKVAGTALAAAMPDMLADLAKQLGFSYDVFCAQMANKAADWAEVQARSIGYPLPPAAKADLARAAMQLLDAGIPKWGMPETGSAKFNSNPYAQALVSMVLTEPTLHALVEMQSQEIERLKAGLRPLAKEYQNSLDMGGEHCDCEDCKPKQLAWEVYFGEKVPDGTT